MAGVCRGRRWAHRKQLLNCRPGGLGLKVGRRVTLPGVRDVAQDALAAGTPLGMSGVTPVPAPPASPCGGTWNPVSLVGAREGAPLSPAASLGAGWGQRGSPRHAGKTVLPGMLDSRSPVSPGTWASGGLCRDPWPWVWPRPTEP